MVIRHQEETTDRHRESSMFSMPSWTRAWAGLVLALASCYGLDQGSSATPLAAESSLGGDTVTRGGSSLLPPSPFNISSAPPAFCPCNATAGGSHDKIRGQKALETHVRVICPLIIEIVYEFPFPPFQEAIRNQTSWIARLHHRATHSRAAFSASVNLGFLLSLIVIGVLATKMWRDKAHRAIQQRQPVQFDSHSSHSEIPVRDMLRKRGRTLVGLYRRLQKQQTCSPDRRHQDQDQGRQQRRQQLRMETFLSSGVRLAPERPQNEEGKGGDEDEVDGESTTDLFHQRLLLSSPSSSEVSTSSLLESSDDDLDLSSSVYSLNSTTGEWGGSGSRRRSRDGEGGRGGRGMVLWFSSLFSWRGRRSRGVSSRSRAYKINAREDFGEGSFEMEGSRVKLLADVTSSEEGEDDDNEVFRIG